MKASKLVLWHRKKEDKITTDRCSDPLNIIDNMEYVSKKIMPESSDSFAPYHYYRDPDIWNELWTCQHMRYLECSFHIGSVVLKCKKILHFEV